MFLTDCISLCMQQRQTQGGAGHMAVLRRVENIEKDVECGFSIFDGYSHARHQVEYVESFSPCARRPLAQLLLPWNLVRP